MSEQSWSPETAAVVAGRPPHRAGAAVSPPVELTSTYVSWEPFGATDPGIYGRMNNATWLALEEAVGALERARPCASRPAWLRVRRCSAWYPRAAGW